MKNFGDNKGLTNQEVLSKVEQVRLLHKDRGYVTFSDIHEELDISIKDSDFGEVVTILKETYKIVITDFIPNDDVSDYSDESEDDNNDDQDDEKELKGDSKTGKTNDPMKLYLSEMSGDSVKLVNRKDEILIAKEMEEGQREVVRSLSSFPVTLAEILKDLDKIDDEDINFKPEDLIEGYGIFDIEDIDQQLLAYEEQRNKENYPSKSSELDRSFTFPKRKLLNNFFA